ncbi:hypothetical protein UA24_20495, partial [Marinomonas sp. BSi20414]|nr:hypothetical protein [Marinomonas sp. BSi20414]
GIDGIYENTNPPPPYVVTETKYRTASGKYIDGDGVARDSMLNNTKGSPGMPAAKQMSDGWIRPRLDQELSLKESKKVQVNGYERWLMIVDDSGKVVNITKLDEAANSINEVIL